MNKWFLVILSFLFISKISAQIPASQNPQIVSAALAEIQKRGLSEEEVRRRLIERGIDVDNIKMEDLPRLQRQIEEVIVELEKEKNQKDADKRQRRADQVNAILDSTDINVDENINRQKDTRQNRRKTTPSVSDTSELPERFVRIGKKKSAKDSIRLRNVEDFVNSTAIDSLDSIPQPAIYGQEIFRNGRLNFLKDKDFRAADTYVLGVGDKVTVSISGNAYYNSTLTVERDGAIAPDRMPRIFVRGMALSKARKVIETNFSRFYPFKKEDFDVSVNAARVVTVNIVGEVVSPGSYTISGGNTAFNALVAANGITDIGSPRNIQVVRTATGERKTLDVYAFLLDPSVTKDFFLFDNDYISVPTADRVVTVQGAVRRPLKYELIRGENLLKLVQFAGGFSENAVQATLQIRRYVNDKEKVVDVNFKDLKERGGDFDLLNGDVVEVKFIPKNLENYANIIGAVELPGNYEITEGGMKISDLLKKAGVRREALLTTSYLQRVNPNQTLGLRFINLEEILANPNSPNNLILQAKDRLLVYSQERFTQKDSVSVYGAVRSGLRFPFDPSRSIRVSDIVTLAGGLKPDATEFGYITRRDPTNYKNVEYLRVDLKKALENPNSVENYALQANDNLDVYSKVNFADDVFVRVSGAVRQPGEYRWDKSLSLRDVLTLAGGMRLEAASNRVDVFRVQLNGNQAVKNEAITVEVDKDLLFRDPSVANLVLQPYDQIVVRNIPEFGLQKMVTVQGEVVYSGPYALTNKNEKLLNLIQRAGGLSLEAFPSGATLYRQQDNIGYIVIRLEEALKNANSSSNLILKDGDIIDIPKTKDIVSIRGATRTGELYPDKILEGGKVNVAFDGEKTAWYYVDKYAAGVGNEGRRRLISVEHPNGQVERTKDFLLFKVYPKVQRGSTITVGYAPIKKDLARKDDRKSIDWGKVLADSVAQATALITLITLLQRF